VNMGTSDEYWPMLDDGGSNSPSDGHADGGDGKGLPPWLVFLMLALGAWMLARALAM
jgi:hypothetical protein